MNIAHSPHTPHKLKQTHIIQQPPLSLLPYPPSPPPPPDSAHRPTIHSLLDKQVNNVLSLIATGSGLMCTEHDIMCDTIA